MIRSAASRTTSAVITSPAGFVAPPRRWVTSATAGSETRVPTTTSARSEGTMSRMCSTPHLRAGA